jgi:hypothetical protein
MTNWSSFEEKIQQLNPFYVSFELRDQKMVLYIVNPRFTLFMQVMTQFLSLETLLDDSVDKEIELQIERGGSPLTVQLKVFIFGLRPLMIT